MGLRNDPVNAHVLREALRELYRLCALQLYVEQEPLLQLNFAILVKLLGMFSIPPMPLLPQFGIVRIQTNHSLTWNRAAHLALKNTRYSSPSNVTKTIIVRANPIHGAVFRTSCWTRPITQVAPACYYQGVFETVYAVVLIFYHVDLYQVLCRAFGTTACGPTVVAHADYETRVCEGAGQGRLFRELTKVGLGRFWDVRESALGDVHELAIAPV